MVIFGVLAYNVKTDGPLLRWDVPVYRSLHATALKVPWYVNEVMFFGYFVGKELIQLCILILGLYFLHKRLWQELTMMLVGSAGGSLVWHFINNYFNRPRPEAQLGISLTNPSFPSGHVSSSVLFYGLLAYLLFPKMPGRLWKWLLVIGTILWLAFAGFSRVFQGGHYLTDVIGGYGWGLAWAGLAFTAVEMFFRSQRSEHVKKR
jgi:membrane-associated phospholipid phosphatase